MPPCRTFAARPLPTPVGSAPGTGSYTGAVVTRRLGAVVALPAALVLAACTALGAPAAPAPPDAVAGGQTTEEARARLAAIDGLRVDELDCAPANVKGNSGCGVRVTLREGYRVAEPASLLGVLVRTAWSLRDGEKPNTSIGVALMGDPGDPFSLEEVAIESGWATDRTHPLPMADNGYTSVSVWIDDDPRSKRGARANRARLGPWPGDPPPIPDGLVTVDGGPDGARGEESAGPAAARTLGSAAGGRLEGRSWRIGA